MEQIHLFSNSQIPSWLPDEILYSLASRYHILTGNSQASSTNVQLFGNSRIGYHHDFPSGVGEFVRRTQKILGDESEIVRQHTILPYYFPFRALTAELDAMTALRSNSVASLKFRLGLLTSRFRANHPLKACSACIESDTKEFGTSYWHLSHQYPGVWRCLVHDEDLLQSTVKSTGVGRFLWYLPHMDTLSPVVGLNDFRQESWSNRALNTLAEIIRAYVISTAGSRFDLICLRSLYCSTLRERGYITNRGALDFEKIGLGYFDATRPLHAICDFLALPEKVSESAAQLCNLLRRENYSTHPLRHLLLIQWLFGNWDNFMCAYNEHLSMQIKNQVHVDGGMLLQSEEVEDDPRKAELYLLLHDKNFSVSKAARQVKIDVSTAMAWSAQLGIATTRRAKILKAPLREALISELKNGVEKKYAAEKYGISIQTVTTTLRTEVGLHAKWMGAQKNERVEQCRGAWTELTNQNPHAGISVLRKLSPSTYTWLYRHDLSWLVNHNKAQLSISRSNNANLNWDERDIKLSEEVKKIALRIHLDNPKSRIYLWQLYQYVPELKSKLKTIERLPLTQKTITSITTQHFYQNNFSNLF